MKKVYLIIILLLALNVSGCALIGNVSEIELTNPATGEKTVIPGSSQQTRDILKAVKTRNKTVDSISDLTSYELTVKKGSRADNYKLSFDPDNKAAYVSQKENTYKVDADTAKALFLNENFSYVYIDSTLYDSYLDYNENKLKPDVEYDWTYKNTEGHFTKKEGTIKRSVNKGDIKISGNDSLDVAYEKPPDSQVIRVYSDDKLAGTGTNLQDVLDKLTVNGEYAVESQAQWLMKKGSQFYGSQTLKFTVDVNRPASMAIVTRENSPGNILLVYVENLNGYETLKLKTDAVKTETEAYKYKERSMFMCPIELNAEPGEYALSIVVNEGTPGEYTIDGKLSVKIKTFKTQYLTVSEEMNETNNNSVSVYEYAQLVKPARTESAAEKLWEGTFTMPVEGELTTDFAEIRYVNNELSSSRHSGLDLAAPLGTEVKAPNNGIVTFAMEGLLSPGNTVVIDHGMGLFTSYYHLNTISVEKGQKVSKGDIIGTVGTTGFSTGPHLHYAVSIYNTYVNPYQPLSGIID